MSRNKAIQLLENSLLEDLFDEYLAAQFDRWGNQTDRDEREQIYAESRAARRMSAWIINKAKEIANGYD
jgi:hypothetical protein